MKEEKVNAEPKEARPKKLFSKMCIRKISRIFILLLIVFLVVGIPIIVMTYMYRVENTTFQSNKDVKFVMSNCRLFLNEDSGQNSNIAYVNIIAPGLTSELSSDNGISVIQATNPGGYLGACEIKVTIHPNFIFGSLSILCNGTCIATHSGTLINVASSLLVNGTSRLDLMLTKLIAKELHVNVTSGHIHIYSGNLAQDSDIKTNIGDVVYQSTSSFTVVASNNFSYPCLYAPYVLYGSRPKVAYESCSVINEDGMIMNCTDTFTLCTFTDDFCESSPRITLQTERGNIFANVIPQEGGYVSDMYQYIKPNGTNEILFDKKSNISLSQFNKNFASTALADQMLIVKFGNFEAFSSASAFFLGATNPAYIAVRPWFITFFSATLLMGGVSVFTDSPIPGLCPFRTSLTFNDVGRFKTLIMNNIQTPSGKFEVTLTYNRRFPRIFSTNTNQNGFRGLNGPIEVYDIIPNKDGDYSFKEKQLMTTVTLAMTVIVSLLLCLLIGVLFEYILILVLLALLENFLASSKHLEEYLKRGGNVSKDALKKENENLRSDDVTHAETGNRTEIPLVKLVKTLPSQYMILDLLVRHFKGYILSSSNEFFKLLFVEVEESAVDDTFQPIQYAVIKELYEKYCFLNQVAEDDLKSESNLNILLKMGFSYESVKDATTQVLRKVKWVLPSKQKDSSSVPSDISSFEQFFRKKIETTEFDEDTIDFDEFKKKYDAWCIDNKLETIVVTRTMMFDIFGVVSDKKEVSYLKKSNEYQHDSKVFVNMCIDRVERQIEILRAQGNSKLKLQKIKGEVKRFNYFPLILDLMSVGIHLLWISIFVALPIILPLFIEVEYNRYSISDYSAGISYDDLIFAPWQLLRKATSISTVTMAFCVIGVTYWGFSFIDLLSYYIFTPLKYGGFSELGKAQDNVPKWAQVIQKISWCYVLLLLMVVAMYISLVLVWALLGAILNPNAYLAYAAGAGTLVTFVTAKYSEFSKMLIMGIKGLQDKLMEKFKTFATEIMKKILTSLNLEKTDMGKALTDAADSNDPLGTLKARAAAVVGNTPLGKQLASFGLDINQAMAIAQGDINAIAELAAKQGIPIAVVTIVVSLVKGKKNEAIKAIEEIAKQVNIPPIVLRLGASIISINNEKSISSFISLITSEWADFMMSRMPKENHSPIFDLIKEILPQLILSINDLKKEDEDMFVNALERMNTYIITAMNKRAKIELLDDPTASLRYFTESGLPKFAIPPFVLNALELHKLYGSEGGQINLGKIQKTLYLLLESFCKVDKKVLSFIFMLINEGLTESSSLTISYSRSEEFDTIKFIEKELGMPSPLMQLVWKIWKEDYMNDQDLIVKLTDFLRKLFPPLKKDFVKFALDLLPLMNLTSGKRAIVSDRAKFGIKEEHAKLVAIMGETDVNLAIILKFNDEPFMHSISDKVHIPHNILKGILLFMSGFVSSSEVYPFIEEVCKRANIDKSFTNVVLSLLVCLVSNDCYQLLPSLRQLEIKESVWILLGKKMIHPMNIADRYFEDLKLNMNAQAIKHRKVVDINNKEMWERWVSDIIDLLDGKSREDRNLLKAQMNEVKVEDVEVKEEVEEKVEEVNKENEEEKKDITLEDQQIKIQRERVKRFLLIEDNDTSQELIKDLLDKCPIYKAYPNEKKVKLLEQLTKLSQIKDIAWLSEVTLMERAIKYLSNDLQFDGNTIQSIFDIIQMRTKETFLEGVKNLFKIVCTKDEMIPIMKYFAYAYEKQIGLETASRVIGVLADKFKIPSIILSKIIVPSVRSNKTLQIEDVYLLLNQFGLNIENIRPVAKEDNQNSEKPQGFSFSFSGIAMSAEDVRYYLSGLIVHNPSAFMQLSKTLKVPQPLLDCFDSALDVTRNNKIKKLTLCFRSIATKMGCSMDLFYTLSAIVQYLCGFKDNKVEDWISSDNNDYSGLTKGTVVDYLGKTLGILPVIFEVFQDSVAQDRRELLKSLPKLIEGMNNYKNIVFLNPHIVPSILGLIQGKGSIPMEELSEKIGVPLELLETCIKMSGLTIIENKIPAKVNQLLSSPIMHKFWEVIKVSPEIIENLVNLSFNSLPLDDCEKIISIFHIKNAVDLTFFKSILSVVKSYVAIQGGSSLYLDRKSKQYTTTLEDMKVGVRAISKFVIMDESLILPLMRLRQGDFFIIEEYQRSFVALLPGKRIRELSMGISGMATLPIMFDSLKKADLLKDGVDTSLTFRNAAEIVCSSLKINPIVARLASVDMPTIKELSKETNTPVAVILWFLQCLSSLPLNVLKFIVVREYLRELHLRSERVFPGEGPKYKGKPIKNKNIEKNIQEESTMLRTGKNKKNLKEEKKEEAKKEEKKNGPNMNLNSAITKLIAKKVEEKKQDSGINKKLLIEEFKALINDCGPDSPYQQIFGEIDFEDEPYTNPLSKIDDPISVAVENELFETLLFNNRAAFPFNPEDLDEENKCQRTFFVSEENIRSIMTKNKYQEELAETFFEGGKNSPDVYSKTKERIVNPYASYPSCPGAKNVWVVIRKFLKDIEARKEKQTKYQRINLSQIILFTSLLGIRKRAAASYNCKASDNNYSLFAGDLHLFILSVESIGILCDLITKINYIRTGMLKIMSFAFNIGIPYSFTFINKDMEYPFDKYIMVFDAPNTQEKKTEYVKAIKNVFEYYNNSNACFMFSNFNEIVPIIENINDLMDCMESYKPINPYNPTSVSELLVNEFVKINENDEELKYLDEEDKSERARRFYLPKHIPLPELNDTAKELLIKQLIPLDKLVVMQYEKMNFFLDLAENVWEGEENIKKFLKDTNLLPLGNKSLAIYSSLAKFNSLRTDILRYEKDAEFIGEFDSKILTPLLNAISSSVPIKVKVIEDIIILLHGILEEGRFNSLAAQYNAFNPELKLNIQIIKLLFISAFSKKGKLNKESFEALIKLLVERIYPAKKSKNETDIPVNMKSKINIILSLISIFKGKYEDAIKNGIKDLVNMGCPLRKNGKKVLESLLDLISWKSTKSKSMFSRIISSEEAAQEKKAKEDRQIKEFGSIKDPVREKQGMKGLIIEIAKTFIPEGQSENDYVQKQEDLDFVTTVLEISISVIKNNVDKLNDLISSNMKLFGTMEEETTKVVLSMFTLILNKANDKGKDAVSDISPYINTIGNWLSKSIVGDLQSSPVKLLPTALKISFGTIFKKGEFQEDVLEELKEVHPFMACILTINQTLKKIKEYVVNNKVSFSSLPSDLKTDAIKSLNLIMSIVEKLFDTERKVNNEAKKEMSADRKAVLPFDGYLKLPSYSGQQWSQTEKQQNVMMETLKMNKFSMKKIEFKKSANEKDSSAADLIKDDPNKYMSLLGAIIMGDIQTIVDMLETLVNFSDKEMKENNSIKNLFGSSEDAKGQIQKIKVIYKIVSMTPIEFRDICANSQKLKEYFDELYDALFEPLLRKLNIPGTDIIIKTVIEMLQKIIYGTFKMADAQSLGLKLMGFIKEKVKKEIGEGLVVVFDNLFGAITGVIQQEGKMIKLGIQVRIDKFIDVFIPLMLPDLQSSITKVKEVVNLSFELYNISGDAKKLQAFLPKLAETLGDLFGINSVQINQVMGIMQGDPKLIKELISPICKLDSPIVEILFGLMKDTAGKMNSINSLVSAPGNKVEEIDKGDWLEILKKVKDGTAEIRDLFRMIELKGGSNGGISKKEFKDLLGKLSMNVTDHRIDEIFSKCKGKNAKAPEVLSLEEFLDSIKYVMMNRVYEGLHLLHISQTELIFLLTTLLIILLLLFIFIFLGIAAFALGGTFGTVINSMMPLIAGAGVGGQSPIDLKSDEWGTKLKEIADTVMDMIGSI